MLTESTEFASATLKSTGYIEVRIDRVILDDTSEVARVPHRHVLEPGDDLTNQHPKVQDLARAAWKPAVVAAFMSPPAAHADPEE